MTAGMYILVPVHNRHDITRGLIECLKAQTFRDYQVILIDDGSKDGTAAMVKRELPNAVVLQGDGSWWWAGSLQKGLDWLTQECVPDDAVISFMNDDVWFSSDYLATATRVMRGKTGSLVLSQFAGDGGESIETGIRADARNLTFSLASTPDEINCLSTRGLFGHWGTIQRIGGFHPRLLPHYLSDYEYTMRAHRKGVKCESSPSLLIVPDLKSTGFHNMRVETFAEFGRKYFSRRSPENVFYWLSFAALASTPRWRLVPNTLRVFFRFFKAGRWMFLRSEKSCAPR